MAPIKDQSRGTVGWSSRRQLGFAIHSTAPRFGTRWQAVGWQPLPYSRNEDEHTMIYDQPPHALDYAPSV